MDDAMESIVEFVQATSYDRLPEEVRRKARAILVDSIGCAFGGRDCRAARIAAELAEPTLTDGKGIVVGSSQTCAADLAAFWNTAMIRYLDFNDHLVAGHPSDMLGALMAVTGLRPVTGRELLTSIAIGYEVHARVVVPMREIDTIDRAYSIGIGATAGLCHLLALSPEQTRHALAMSVTSGVSLRTARVGELSDYKGVASAVETRFAVFAAMLAMHGLTGPPAPFQGRHGLGELLTGTERSFHLEPFDDWKMLQTCHKYWPVAYNIQPAVWAALELRQRLDWRNIQKVILHAAAFAWFESGRDEEKWNPQTRETADHSLPYVFARALQYGTIDQGAFELSAFQNSETLSLMARITVRADPDWGPQVSDVVGVRAEATTTAGETVTVSVDRPKGHFNNPMTVHEISRKSHRLMERVLGQRAHDAINLAWDVESLTSTDTLFEALKP